MRYWLDANVFITAKNTVYAFEINNSLWNWLDKKLEDKSVLVPSRVFREIMDYNKDDLLKQWAKARKGNGLCVEPDKDVWRNVGKISDFLYNATKISEKSKRSIRRYSDAQIQEFDRGADAMVIAHAMADNGHGTVVTFETDLKSTSKKIRIPDVCHHFGVPYTNLKGLLMAFGDKL